MKDKSLCSSGDGLSSLTIRTSLRGLSFRLFFLGFAYLFLIVLGILLMVFLLPSYTYHNRLGLPSAVFETVQLGHLPEFRVPNLTSISRTQKNCTYYTCFDVYKCSHTHSGRIGVYLYPLIEFVDEDEVPLTKKISKEFFNILKAIKESVYFTSDPNEACLFIPTIDLLNQNRIRPKEVSKALTTLP